jgi:hypothetical protein
LIIGREIRPFLGNEAKTLREDFNQSFHGTDPILDNIAFFWYDF